MTESWTVTTGVLHFAPMIRVRSEEKALERFYIREMLMRFVVPISISYWNRLNHIVTRTNSGLGMGDQSMHGATLRMFQVS